ncbi:hypothetical protein TA3x_005662 [Tundrisphaera sp. TA3]|uniref:hypothetical protein n=1 Tax=Tundrisphaera sp. TA3 TaxID=3435775 RepID=UPI003EB8C2FF
MTDEPARTKSTRGCLFAFLIVTIPWLAITKVTSPADWVDVKVGPIPKGCENFCLIAEDSQGIGTLPWYHSKVVADAVDPFMGGALSGEARNHKEEGFFIASVRWREAKGYGVLAQRADGRWRLWWIEPSALRRPSASRFIYGRAPAGMRLPAEASAQVPSEPLLKRLGHRREPGP